MVVQHLLRLYFLKRLFVALEISCPCAQANNNYPANCLALHFLECVELLRKDLDIFQNVWNYLRKVSNCLECVELLRKGQILTTWQHICPNHAKECLVLKSRLNSTDT